MLPLRDANPTRITPYVTLGLIAVNIVVFFLIQGRGSAGEQQAFVYERAAIACEVTTGDPLGVEEITSGQCVAGAQAPVFPGKNVYLAVFTSMFLHGSIGHLLFNMWFLWIFGNNVEEAYGHLGYLLLYLVGGLAGTAAFVALNADATIPLVGASGAIAVTMGAYAVLFPKHRVLSLLGWIILPLPAGIFLFVWFVAQFGLGGTGVAWEAHAGGFVFGVAVSLLLRGRLLARVATLWGRCVVVKESVVTVVGKKGRVVISASIRRAAGISEGTEILSSVDEMGRVVIDTPSSIEARRQRPAGGQGDGRGCLRPAHRRARRRSLTSRRGARCRCRHDRAQGGRARRPVDAIDDSTVVTNPCGRDDRQPFRQKTFPRRTTGSRRSLAFSEASPHSSRRSLDGTLQSLHRSPGNGRSVPQPPMHSCLFIA